MKMSTLLDSLSSIQPIVYNDNNSQKTHRFTIFQSWLKLAQENKYDLDATIIGKQTLDIGCGQGDMIALFAAGLKAQGNEESKVIGVDPASLDYGEPWTLGDAQFSISTGPLGKTIRFIQTTAPALVASQAVGTYSSAYFAHSLYYFPSSTTLTQTFQALLDAGVKTLLLAEWSLSISHPTALPHLLAVLLQSIDPLADGNVRTVLSPAAYVDAATRAGWELVGSTTFTPAADLDDGKWETRFARSVAAGKGAGKRGRRTESVSLRAHADALERSMGDEVRVRCMDVWTAVFRPARSTNEFCGA